jgi:hypothetical protein
MAKSHGKRRSKKAAEVMSVEAGVTDDNSAGTSQERRMMQERGGDDEHLNWLQGIQAGHDRSFATAKPRTSWRVIG